MKKVKPKVKEKKKDEENFDYMKTNKDNLKNIIKDNNIILIINKLVERTNKIIIHSYQFLKLYLIHRYQNNKKFPIIDKNFISDIFKAITIRKCNKGKSSDDNLSKQYMKLIKFYKNHYSLTIPKDDIIYYDKLSYILPYEAIDMVTNINNNISEHFIDHVNKYINLVFDVKNRMKTITDNTTNKELCKELKKEIYDSISKIKYDLLSFNDELTSDKSLHSWIINKRKQLFPYKTEYNRNIYYDIKVNPQDYLYSMFYLEDQIENMNKLRLENDIPDTQQIRLFNVLPLRTNIIGKNICIDTCALISNFLGEESTTEHLKNYKKDDNQYNLWNRFFRLNKKVFNKNNYKFSYMIRTDAISSCILFVRVDNNGNIVSKKFKKCSEELNTDYIEKTTITEQLKNMKVVVADPGKSDLIYCGSRDSNSNLETFRYTQNQRRLETRNKKYNKIIQKINTETKINDINIKEHETILSKHNSKTVNYDMFKNYCIEKNKINNILYQHYQQNLFRKLKFNRFINTQKSESKLVKNFSNKFGKPKDTIFIIGDYDKGDHNMKGLEPSICKRFRRIFKNAGYKTFLINEFRTMYKKSLIFYSSYFIRKIRDFSYNEHQNYVIVVIIY